MLLLLFLMLLSWQFLLLYSAVVTSAAVEAVEAVVQAAVAVVEVAAVAFFPTFCVCVVLAASRVGALPHFFCAAALVLFSCFVSCVQAMRPH